jgi:hypothetical protein
MAGTENASHALTALSGNLQKERTCQTIDFEFVPVRPAGDGANSGN